MKYFNCFSYVWAVSIAISMTTETTAQEQLTMNRTNGIQGGIVQTLLVMPDNTIWAGSSDGGIMRSADDGISWEQVNTGLPFRSNIFCLAYDKDAVIYTGTAQGIFRLDGKTWLAINNGLPPGEVRALLCPQNDTLIAGTSRGIYRSGDKGAHWFPADLQIHIKKFASQDPGRIFAAGGGVYMSIDNGRSWMKIGNDSIIGANSICIDSAGYLFVGTNANGLFCSSDSGRTWQELDAGLHYMNFGIPSTYIVFALEVGPHNEIIFTSNKNPQAFFISTDEGDSWSIVSGYGVQSNFDIVCITNDNRKRQLVGGHECIIARSSDRGKNWTQLNLMMPAPGNEVESIAFDSSGSVLVGALNGYVYRSQDNGVNWSWSQPLSYYYNPIRAIFVSAWGTIYTGGDAPAASTDGGKTFSLLKWMPPINCFAGDTTGFLFAGTRDQSNYCSSDKGQTWVKYDFPTMFSCAIMDSTGHIIAGTYGNGLFLSADHGKTFTPFGFRDTNIQSITASAGRIWVATYSQGIFSYEDERSGWVYRGLKGVKLTSVESFDNSTIFACGEGSGYGYYASTDGGASWHLEYPLSNDWNTSILLCLKRSPDGYLWGGSQDAVVYRSTRSILSSVALSDHASLPHSIVLEQNYPNPFNPSTTISFSIPAKARVSLKIFDVMGRDVATIVSEELPAGSYQRQWNASGMPSGVYFYRLQAAAYTETKRLVLLK